MVAGVLTYDAPLGTVVNLQDTNSGQIRAINAAAAAIGNFIVPNLAALSLVQGAPNGSSAYVLDQAKSYELDTTNTFALSSPLIVAANGGGRWFQISKAYVVGNFTLWCQSFGFGIVGYTPGQQVGNPNTSDPDIVLNMTALCSTSGNQQGVITDNQNNLWLLVNGNGFLSTAAYRFNLSDCLQSGAPTPAVSLVLAIPGQSEAAGAAFDSRSGLWLMNGGHGTLGIASFARYGVRAYSLSSGTPGLTLSINQTDSTSNMQDLAFDGQGNLWCTVAFSSAGFNGGVFMLTAAQVQAGGAQVPTIWWTGSNFTGPGLGAEVGIAVAPNGFIWTADFAGVAQVRAWAPTHATGNPAPDITLTSTTWNDPYTLTFDAAGNLWVNDGAINLLSRIPAASLGVSGAVVPDVTLIPATATLTSKFTFPNNPERVGLLPSGF